jgi:hypothetical protein
MLNKTNYLYFESVLEMLQNNIEVYKKILNTTKSKTEEQIKGEFFEIFANNHCFEKNHLPLISTFKKGIGFDGIYLDNNNDIYFMEAKYHSNKFNIIFKKCETTISGNNDSRLSEIDNSRNKIKEIVDNDYYKVSCKSPLFRYLKSQNIEKIIDVKINDNLFKSFEKLDKYLETLSYDSENHKLEDKDKVFYLANNDYSDNLTLNHSVKEVVCVKIREKEI